MPRTTNPAAAASATKPPSPVLGQAADPLTPAGVAAGATATALSWPPTPPALTAAAGTRANDPAHPVAARDRIGMAFPYGQITDYDWGASLPGWYLSWWVRPMPLRPGRTQFAQMVRVYSGVFSPGLPIITTAARWNPGSLWLIGNEPDVAVQDNDTPEQYAPAYKTLYDAIKAADPTAQVAIGGIGQPTPLRLIWLDRVRAVYRGLYGTEIPVDVWNIHAFILREERDSWGVGIPPGLDVNQGRLYEVADHTNMAIFRQQIVDFRRWMAERGLRDKPLIVTEYGVLMPENYGFPPEAVARFMTDTFDFFLTARDSELGYPADDNRLVQSFCWYSAADRMFPTSNLFDVGTRSITPLGERFKDYVGGLP